MRIAALTSLIVVTACAAPEKEKRKEEPPAGSSAAMAAQMADMQKMMLEMQAAQNNATKNCEPQRTRAPGFAEERAIGTELAISLAAKNGHFYLDGASETDPRKLEKELADRKQIVLPEGKKNAVSAHVAVVGRHLARFSSRPDLPWVFGVVENDTPNSFSAPGGYVFITTGLLKKITNEAQLAGVLAHEISHVTQKDMLGRYVEAKYKQCIAAKTAAAMIKAGGPRSPAMDEVARFADEFDGELDLDKPNSGLKKFLLDAVMMVTMLGGSDKDTEFAHDHEALQLVSFAGYDANEYEKVLVSMALPNHPPGAERATKLQALRQGELKAIAIGTARPDLTKLLAPLSK